jgi:hypothetical protein
MLIYDVSTRTVTGSEEVTHKEKYGGYNSKPPNWKEITEERFAHCDFFTYAFTKVEYRQFQDPENNSGYKGFISVQLFYMPAGHGYGIISDRKNKRVRYFRFGCEHEYVGLDPEECRRQGIPHYGRSYSVAKCKKCGHIYTCDSSD